MTVGAGFVPFGVGPFGSESIEYSALVRAQIPSSRLIDGSGRPVFVDDYTGGFSAMNDSFHRAYLLICRSVKSKDKITPSNVEELRSDIRTALLPLTARQGSTAPVLELIDITIEDTGKDRMDTYVSVRDLLSGETTVLKPQ